MERYSDDGEPQGTAGQPMLNVFQREGVTNVCCVVTRYFGGILLGRGLVGPTPSPPRTPWTRRASPWCAAGWRWPCPAPTPSLSGSLELEAHGGVLGEVEYAADVTVHALLPEERAEAFSAWLTELAAGGVAAQVCGESFQAVPRTQV
ncbi:MAG: YigZ family protein [Flavonifractor plautii]